MELAAWHGGVFYDVPCDTVRLHASRWSARVTRYLKQPQFNHTLSANRHVSQPPSAKCRVGLMSIKRLLERRVSKRFDHKEKLVTYALNLMPFINRKLQQICMNGAGYQLVCDDVTAVSQNHRDVINRARYVG